MTKTSRHCCIVRFERGFTLLELVVVLVIVVALASTLIIKVDKVRVDADDTTSKAMLTTLRDAFSGSAGAPGYLPDVKYVPGFDPLNLRPGDLLQAPSYLPLTAKVYDLVARRGWRGPYLVNTLPVRIYNASTGDDDPRGSFPKANDRRFRDDLTFQERGFYDASGSSAYGSAGDPAIADHWGDPFVIQIPPTGPLIATDADRFKYARIVSAGPNGKLETPLEDPLAGLTTGLRKDDMVIFLNRADVDEP